MSTVGAYEAKTHLPRLIRAAERGETVIQYHPTWQAGRATRAGRGPKAH